MSPTRFNVRVYGIWKKNHSILISHERSGDLAFTKFPGGGLEHGEGIKECLKREFREELEVEINNLELFHINEDLVISAFNPEEQLISIYYLVSSNGEPKQPETAEERWGRPYHMRLEWIPLSLIHEDDFYFPVDKIVAKKIRESAH